MNTTHNTKQSFYKQNLKQFKNFQDSKKCKIDKVIYVCVEGEIVGDSRS